MNAQDIPSPSRRRKRRSLSRPERASPAFARSLVAFHGTSYAIPVTLAIVRQMDPAHEAAWAGVIFALSGGLILAHIMLAATLDLLCCREPGVAAIVVGFIVFWAGLLALWTEVMIALTAVFVWFLLKGVGTVFIQVTFHRQRLVQSPNAAPLPPWQYSLRHLFWATTLVACFLGALRSQFWTWDLYSGTAAGRAWTSVAPVATMLLMVGVVGVAVLLLAILPAWLTLRMPRPQLGAICYTAFLLTLATVGCAVGGELEKLPYVLTAAVTYAVATTGTLLLLLRAGYRLVPSSSPEARR